MLVQTCFNLLTKIAKLITVENRCLLEMRLWNRRNGERNRI